MPSLLNRWRGGIPAAYRGEFAGSLDWSCRQSLRRGLPLTLALAELTGVTELGAVEGDDVVASRVAAAATTLRRLSRRDHLVEAFQSSDTEFSLVLRRTTVGEAFEIGAAVRRRIAHYAAPLDAMVALAVFHPRWCPDADGLHQAALATLDKARELGGPRVLAGLVSGGEWTWLQPGHPIGSTVPDPRPPLD